MSIQADLAHPRFKIIIFCFHDHLHVHVRAAPWKLSELRHSQDMTRPCLMRSRLHAQEHTRRALVRPSTALSDRRE